MTHHRASLLPLLCGVALCHCHPSAPASRSSSASASAVASASAPVSASAPASGSALAARPRPQLPPKLATGPVEADDDPRVRADTAGVCNQLKNKRFGSFNQMATFTRRWAQLSFLYAHGDQQAACDIEKLVSRAAAQSGSPCTQEHVERFAEDCRR